MAKWAWAHAEGVATGVILLVLLLICVLLVVVLEAHDQAQHAQYFMHCEQVVVSKVLEWRCW